MLKLDACEKLVFYSINHLYTKHHWNSPADNEASRLSMQLYLAKAPQFSSSRHSQRHRFNSYYAHVISWCSEGTIGTCSSKCHPGGELQKKIL